MLFYAYSTGAFSSRNIEERLYGYGDVAFRFFAAENFPDHKTISNFRRRHLGTFRGPKSCSEWSNSAIWSSTAPR